MQKLSYILDRLKEPGSVRSLVLALFLVRGWTIDEAQIAVIVDAALGTIALASFLLPGSSAPTVKAESLEDTVQRAVSQAITSVTKPS